MQVEHYSYKDLKVTYNHCRTVVDGMLKICDAIKLDDYSADTKPIVAMFYGMLPAKYVERDGLHFEFDDQIKPYKLKVNGVSIPFYEPIEIRLLDALFNWHIAPLKSDFQWKKQKIITHIWRKQKYFNKFFTTNQNFTVTLLRQMRMYGLQHDHGMTDQQIKTLFNWKTWKPFKAQLKEAVINSITNNSEPGIDITPGMF